MALTMSAQIVLFVVYAATCVQAAGSVDEKAKITLACLLGGIPAASIIMFAVFCVWIKRRKRRAQKDALANGIELGPDGWPLKPTHAVHLAENGSIAGTVSEPPPAYQGRRSDVKTSA